MHIFIKIILNFIVLICILVFVKFYKELFMENILNTIKLNNLVKSGDIVAVACSGGADSMALLHILKKYEEELNIEVIAVTINHGIRENGERDAQFVQRYCRENKIRCYKFNVDVPKIAKAKAISLESAGREARYGIFDALVQKGVADKIALAHHTSDQAETILLHLFRGAGLSGVKGMDYQKGDTYIRPMLSTSKKEVLDYINYYDIPYVEDETNKESTYTRNFLRNEIFPLLLKKWPNIVNTLINFSKSAGEDDDYIQKNLNDDALLIEDKVARIPLTYFLHYDESVINRIIFKAIHAIGVGEDIERKHVDAIKELARNSENGKKIDLPLSIVAYKEYEYLTLTNKKKTEIKLCEQLKCGEFAIENVGKIVVKRVKDFIPRPNVLYVDYKKVPRDAIWRFRQNGDVFEKFGSGQKKLKEYLIDKKIPQRERNFIPVLASGSEVLVVAGYEISNKVKIEDDIKTALKIEFIKNKN